jgi:hypothetical protein
MPDGRHHECKDCIQNRYVTARFKAEIRRQSLWNNWKITVEQFDELLALQGGVCAICGTDKPAGNGKIFAIDHDHKTGLVRGLLCYACNVGLGFFKDNVGVMEKAIQYLKDNALEPVDN